MDLTDKINIEDYLIVSNDPADIEINEYIEDSFKNCLRKITPKVAIDFAKWLTTAPYIGMNNLYINITGTKEYTSEQVFQEFLKDYKYEN